MPDRPTNASFWHEKENSCKPYGPPILHRDFPKRLPTGGFAKSAKSFFASFSFSSGNTNTVDVEPSEVVELYLINTPPPPPPGGAAAAAEYRSQSFNDKTANYDAVQIVDEYFRLPLKVADNGTVSAEAWLTETKIVFSVKVVPQADKLSLVLTGRTGSDLEENLGDLTINARDYAQHPDNAEWRRYEAKLTDVLADPAINRLKQLLTWQNSPYRLQLSYLKDGNVDSCAWTYFHVPSQLEVRVLEDLGEQKIIMMNDAAWPLEPFGSVRVRSKQDEADLSPKADELKNFNSVLCALDLPSKRRTLRETIATLAGPEHADFPMVVRKWDSDKADALGTDTATQQSDNPTHYADAYQGEPNTDNPNFRTWLQKKQEQARDRQAGAERDVAKVEEKIGDGYVPDDDGQIEAIRAHLAQAGQSGKTAFDYNPMSTFFQRSAAPRTHFGVMSWGGITIVRRTTAGDWYPERLYRCGPSTVAIRSAPDAFEPIQPQARLLNRPRQDDPYTGGRGSADGGWKVFDFPAPPHHIVLEYLITYSITSCASMMFFPYEADPKVIIFTHLMGRSSIAFEQAFDHVMNPGAPLGAYPQTEWRGIGTTWPEASEIHRYQPASVFPDNLARVRAVNLETILCPRESHIWGEVQYGGGHLQYGLAFPRSNNRANEKAKIIGRFDHERVPGAGVANARNTRYQRDQGEAHKLMHDFINCVHGTHEHRRKMYTGDEGKLNTARVDDFKAFVDGLRDRSLNERALFEARPQDTMIRLHNVGRTLYDQMAGQATLLKETPCQLVMEKAMTEIHTH